MTRATPYGVLLVLMTAPLLRAQNLAYEKFRLPNDLTVILHADRSLPIACVNVWYRVGSKDEAPGRSGFAHLFEHLMFMGTHRVPGSDFDNLMEAGGGYNNASTSEDRTNYFETGPVSLLPTLLWLEADRMEALADAMTAEKLDLQRQVVLNERRQTGENRPYGKAEMRIPELMFPGGHPYHHPVIGSHADLEAATLTDVKDFFHQWYIPANASLVVAGDFDPQAVKPLIRRLFGDLPRGSDPVHPEAKPAGLDEVKRITMTDNVQFRKIFLIWHSPAAFQPGDAEADLMASILADGVSSRLYQALIYDRKLAIEVDAIQDSLLLGSLFSVEILAAADADLGEVEAVTDRILADFARTGPTAEELERQKNLQEYQRASEMQSLLRKADLLNKYEYFYGEPDSFERDLDRYRQATREGVREAARGILKPERRLILTVVPQAKELRANPRDGRPAPLAAHPFQPPEPERFQLSNGLAVRFWARPDVPLVAVRLLLPGGSDQDPAGRSGLASLTADMLDEGAGERGALAFANALDLLGAELEPAVSRESSVVDLTALARYFAPSLALMADAALRPRFEPAEWTRVRNLRMQNLEADLDQPAAVARRVGMRLLFGDGNPLAWDPQGSPESVGRLELADVQRFHTAHYRPEEAVLLVAGGLTGTEARAALEQAFGSWRAKAPPPAPPAAAPSSSAPSLRVVVVDRPDAVQTVIQLYLP
ncbi:MAG: M16 family metallopeptidase, partial [Planctomycetota bacterium]